MDNPVSLTHHFLIAMPGMTDSNFSQTVIYICEHSEEGAVGIIINRPTSIKLVEVLNHMQIPTHNKSINDIPVLFGGPLHNDRGFVIHRPLTSFRTTMQTSPDIAITTSRDILYALIEQQTMTNPIVSLGYAGWSAGQLEEELSNKNYWLCVPASPHIIFNTPFEERWVASAALMGIDITTLSREMGHA